MQDNFDLNQENERLRSEKRAIAEKYRQSQDEKETLRMKADKQRASLKSNKIKLREAISTQEEQTKVIASLEEQTQ
jgi:hypothetical protein